MVQDEGSDPELFFDLGTNISWAGGFRRLTVPQLTVRKTAARVAQNRLESGFVPYIWVSEGGQ